MRDVARVFKALGDETRLVMVALLLHEGELCVCDCEQAFDVTQSKASRHLRYLRDAGVLVDRRETVWMYYDIAPQFRADFAPLVAALVELLPPSRLGAARERLLAFQAQKEMGVTCARRPQTS